MNHTVVIRVTYVMQMDDVQAETCIDIPVNREIALLLRLGSVEDGYLNYRAKVYTMVNTLAVLQGYDGAEIVKIRHAPKGGA